MSKCNFCVFRNDSKGSGCSALVAPIREDCPFYKTSRQYEDGQRRANVRLSGLEQDKQDRIAAAYFGGKERWRES